MSYIGTNKIDKMYLGSTEIAKAYLGSNLVFQKGGGQPQQYTITLVPSSHDTTDYAYYAFINPSYGYTNADSTTYSQLGLTRGSEGAITYAYYKFDTSAIPANATIDSVSCTAKYSSPSTTNSNNIRVRQIQMFSGTTAKGDANSINNTGATAYSLSVGTWTRQELSDTRIRLYAERGSRNVSSSYAFRFYGATLTITYTA